MITSLKKEETSIQLLVVSFLLNICIVLLLCYLKQKDELENIQLIIQHWIRLLNIKLRWIHDFDKIIVKYVMFIQIKFKIIDYITFDDNQYLGSGSHDKKIFVWDTKTNQRKQTIEHPSIVNCVKFSLYHYYNYKNCVICFSSNDSIIVFWDFINNKQLQILNGPTFGACGIEFSPFHGGKYLCSGAFNNTVDLWDIETSKSLHVFNGHKDTVWCVAFSPLQNKCIGAIGGNGYNICSGSWDNTIRVWDIETTKQLILFDKHEDGVNDIKYGFNTILSGASDTTVRLFDIRSNQQIEIFNGHRSSVNAVEYSPFIDNSNIICSGSLDNTICFWDIRSNKKELYVINGDRYDCGIFSFKFVPVKKQENKDNIDHDICVYYGSQRGYIRCIFLNKLTTKGKKATKKVKKVLSYNIYNIAGFFGSNNFYISKLRISLSTIFLKIKIFCTHHSLYVDDITKPHMPTELRSEKCEPKKKKKWKNSNFGYKKNCLDRE
ncbi:G-protein beta WD-40 repeats containing protein [Reticulomyxa filosa]|uniref:G-protein beta WD-40 repeats containing protein n=1 Tax=Reticulomyxa filosa TaxID=46433 RepID=X6L8G1_RETFI|nr:G-protein beta WD-40 repeats containing protein [Reticulomyxa filosa]|eukprot:ETN97790.1 G-protein beta WD-40 repeats containing protein [Reticulomyxa filosa]